jgi:Kef-type K+ transport system membrane component KefB
MFGAMLGGIICRRIGVAPVVGEILAGVMLAPTLFGGMVLAGLHPVVLNNEMKVLANAGIILLIFLAGLETSFKRFISSGVLATLVAVGGMAVSFIATYALCTLWGIGSEETLIISAATTATSISITFRTLKDLNVSQTEEGIILISSAVIDDVLGMITLGIVLGIIIGTHTDIATIGVTAAKDIGIWCAMLVTGIFLMAKIIDRVAPALKKYASSKVLAFVACFAFAWTADFAGLSPIIGSFIAGMSIAETRIKDTAIKMATDMSSVLAVLFFAFIGAQVSLSSISIGHLIFSVLLVLACIAGKVAGSGIPVLLVRKSLKEAVITGIGMIPRVEVALVIASIGFARGILSRNYYSALIIMVIVTTLLTPIALKSAYRIFDMKGGNRVKPQTSNQP